MAIVVLDLGTTGNRAIAYSEDGVRLFQAYEEFKLSTPQPGWVEQNPLDIWDSCYRVLSDVVTKVGIDQISVIGLTNQRETTIVWDTSTGVPVYNAIVWQCRRTADMCHQLSEYRDLVKSKTGLFLDPYFSATKLKWILDRVQSRTLRFGTVDSWIIWKLTQGKVHATDSTNASRTMLLNIHTGQYDDDLLSLFGIPKSILPEVRPCDAQFGYCQLFGRDIPIRGVMGDQQASLFGHGGWQEGIVKNTYGTGLFLMASTGQVVSPSDRLISTIAWDFSGRREYAMEGSIFTGGSLIQWLRDELGMICSSDETESLANSVSDTNGVVIVPALSGLGAPFWDAHARGVIMGLSRGVTRAHIVRAALEALAYQTKSVADEMMASLPQGMTTLRVDGGACRNTFLMQFQADVLSCSIDRPTELETTAFGAALMAGIASGIWTLDDGIKLRQSDRVFVPTPGVESQYLRWTQAVTYSQAFGAQI